MCCMHSSVLLEIHIPPHAAIVYLSETSRLLIFHLSQDSSCIMPTCSSPKFLTLIINILKLILMLNQAKNCICFGGTAEKCNFTVCDSGFLDLLIVDWVFWDLVYGVLFRSCLYFAKFKQFFLCAEWLIIDILSVLFFKWIAWFFHFFNKPEGLRKEYIRINYIWHRGR